MPGQRHCPISTDQQCLKCQPGNIVSTSATGLIPAKAILEG